MNDSIVWIDLKVGLLSMVHFYFILTQIQLAVTMQSKVLQQLANNIRLGASQQAAITRKTLKVWAILNQAKRYEIKD